YHTMLSHCPICDGPITATRLECEHCEVKIEGKFELTNFANLSPEQLLFVETFLRCEGKINRVEKELGISYPTVRSRLHEIIRAMGFEPVTDVEAEHASREQQRLEVLEKLSAGQISPDEAVDLLSQ
ncbi:MAG: hypothetical protein CUN55_17440, partial [Phototrophicales bacterium]